MTRQITITACLMFLFTFACNEEGDFFFVKRLGAKMPVWVKGNQASDTMLLSIPGGPGATGLHYQWSDAYQVLHQDYAVAYWELRSSGVSQGSPPAESLTLSEYVADADLVIDSLRLRHGPKRLVLVGHSFGGAVAAGYLLEETRRDKVTGWVNICGARHWEESYAASRAMVLETAVAILADETRTAEHDTWRSTQEWYQEFTKAPSNMADQIQHNDYVNAALAEMGYDAMAAAEASMSDLTKRFLNESLTGPFSLTGAFLNQLRTNEHFDRWSMDITEHDLRVVDTPALVIAGRYDGCVPPPVSEETFNGLGTPADEKTYVLFNESGHFPIWEEPDLLVDSVTSFVESLAP